MRFFFRGRREMIHSATTKIVTYPAPHRSEGGWHHLRQLGPLKIWSTEITMSFLGLEGYHVFITGAAGGIGLEAVKEFLG